MFWYCLNEHFIFTVDVKGNLLTEFVNSAPLVINDKSASNLIAQFQYFCTVKTSIISHLEMLLHKKNMFYWIQSCALAITPRCVA